MVQAPGFLGMAGTYLMIACLDLGWLEPIWWLGWVWMSLAVMCFGKWAYARRPTDVAREEG